MLRTRAEGFARVSIHWLPRVLKSADMAATWVKQNIADRVRLVTTYIGDLALFRGVPVTA
ncbi:MAG: hypothetical protein M3O78_03805 [Chloroflexota bacterium]|nr:hypothetical protein [Chloroflexota bacterium]